MGLQFHWRSEVGYYALDGAGAVARVFDDLQIAALTGWFDAEEHAAPNRDTAILRSEERRVGKECRPRRVRHHYEKKPNFRPSEHELNEMNRFITCANEK